ncbi:MAG TPA: ion transporter [Rhodothermales bacterium]|nr:ion transporter [Rhodothermales bacterium]
MIERIKRRTYEVLEGSYNRDPKARLFQWFIITLILLNVVAVILATEAPLYAKYEPYFEWFELVSVVIFTIEYVLRVWVCTEGEKFSRPIVGRLRYMITWGAIIDLLAILPFFLRFAPVDLRAIRSLRLLRLFRLLKLGRYSRSITILVDVLKGKKEQIVLAILAVFVVLAGSASLIYFIEREAQPEHFGSIPQAMWWSVVTLTTVGYGDIYPTTVLGKMLGGLISLLGIGLIALPAGILASGFQEAVEKKQQLDAEDEEEDGEEDQESEARYCPHCGEPLHNYEDAEEDDTINVLGVKQEGM